MPSKYDELSAQLAATTGSNVRRAAERLLTPRQLEITSMDASQLLQAIATKEVSAVETLTAFGIRTAVAHKLTCCLTDLFLDEAMEQARELDRVLQQTGRTVGPLHGLPISAKDQVQLKGRITSTSFLSLHVTATPEQNDCSSGGEGAVLGMRGALMGIGTDIGGSVRSPAAACGLYGLRPTALRIPGVATYKYGRESIMGTAGPLAHSARDIELFMSVVLGPESSIWLQDPNVLEMPWREGRRGCWQDGNRKLRVGVMWDDGEVRPTKPIERAMNAEVGKLQNSQLVQVKDFLPYGTREAWYLARELVLFPRRRKTNPRFEINSNVQEPLHPLTTWLLEESGPELKRKTPEEIWEVTARRDAFRKRYRQHWLEQDVDVILCPNAPYPAPQPGTAKWWAYTSHFNVVDHPAVTFPTGLQVDLKLDELSEEESASFEARNPDEALAHANYSPDKYKNAPLCLQLVARRFHDEELLDALQLIERELTA
ncbi:hypothetical protein ACM66B_006265 [Microbotryomycetes sp. NB124-2]